LKKLDQHDRFIRPAAEKKQVSMVADHLSLSRKRVSPENDGITLDYFGAKPRRQNKAKQYR
jgi:hypothetical protein